MLDMVVWECYDNKNTRIAHVRGDPGSLNQVSLVYFLHPILKRMDRVSLG